MLNGPFRYEKVRTLAMLRAGERLALNAARGAGFLDLVAHRGVGDGVGQPSKNTLVDEVRTLRQAIKDFDTAARDGRQEQGQ